MSDATLEAQRVLRQKLKRLEQFDKAMAHAAQDALTADNRWKEARKQYADLWAEIVEEYGESSAPTWFGAQRGQKPVVKGGA